VSISAAASSPIRLLCVEDNPDDVELMALTLERADPQHRYELARVDDANAFLEAVSQDFDAILCDFNMPRFSPYAALQILVARRCGTPLIVVTRAIGEEAAVHVLRCGAKDYLTKDKLGTLPQIIERVMNERRRVVQQEQLGLELEAAYRRLKKLSARLVVAQERERTLISRELHDQLGQTLTGMVLHLHAAKKATDPDAVLKHTDTAMEMAQGAVSQLKTLSLSVRPAQLALRGAAHRRTCRPALYRPVARDRAGQPERNGFGGGPAGPGSDEQRGAARPGDACLGPAALPAP
jgi:signal transduction histidine kinase